MFISNSFNHSIFNVISIEECCFITKFRTFHKTSKCMIHWPTFSIHFQMCNHISKMLQFYIKKKFKPTDCLAAKIEFSLNKFSIYLFWMPNYFSTFNHCFSFVQVQQLKSLHINISISCINKNVDCTFYNLQIFWMKLFWCKTKSIRRCLQKKTSK